MRGLVLAWAVGLGLFTWRNVQQYHKPPVPGRVLGASLVYVMLALVAEYEPARWPAVAAAWGFDLAILFQIGPAQLVQGAGWITGGQGAAAGGPPGPARQGPGGQGERSGIGG